MFQKKLNYSKKMAQNNDTLRTIGELKKYLSDCFDDNDILSVEYVQILNNTVVDIKDRPFLKSLIDIDNSGKVKMKLPIY